MTLSIDNYPAPSTLDPAWLIKGNSRFKDLSGLLLGAHLAHGGLILFWAGATTLGEVGRFIPGESLAQQKMILLPHLASLGWGVGTGGEIVNTFPYFVIAVLHLVASAVLAAGGLFHTVEGGALKNFTGRAIKFHYDWNDPKKLSFILGHHLIFLGLGAFLLVIKAMFIGGIYDPAIGEVRLVTNPTLNPFNILGYMVGLSHGSWTPLGMAAVDNLEEIVGGHFLLGFVEIIGGIWHIKSTPSKLVQNVFLFNGDAILSYSLAGLALMAYTSVYFVAFNTTAFPNEFYGTNRTSAIAIQSLLGFICLGGHLWHAFKAGDQTYDLNVLSLNSTDTLPRNGKDVVIIAKINAFSDCDLKLISLEDANALPKEGKKEIVVAKINDSYQVCIFDETGNIFINKGKGEFIPESKLVQHLDKSLGEQSINSETKSQLIQQIAESLGYGDCYQVRIFDKTGNLVLDKGKNEFSPNASLVQEFEQALSHQSLDQQTKDNLVQKITATLRYTLPRKLKGSSEGNPISTALASFIIVAILATAFILQSYGQV